MKLPGDNTVNAVIKQKPAPRTVEQLAAELSRIESDLTTARRESGRLRTAMPVLLAETDETAIAQCRRDSEACNARIEKLASRVDDTREALQLAQARDRAAAHARIYKEIRQSAAASQRDLVALADAIDTFGLAFNAARTGLQSLAAHTTRAGVAPEMYEYPHLMHGRLLELTERALFLASGGAIGKPRALNAAEQLATGVTGGSVIQQTANEFFAMTMRRTQAALHLNSEPTE
jgi:hypothetical protein